MTAFEDLSPCTYFGRWEEVLVAVGWLDATRDYSRGPVREEVFAALTRLLVDPWQPAVLSGHAECSFCRFSKGPSQLRYDGKIVILGANNVFVPAGKAGLFVAPSMIIHYIDAHQYSPPDAFQEAVLRCPEMKSVPYLKEVMATGFKLR
jgi:hypothetical protein